MLGPLGSWPTSSLLASHCSHRWRTERMYALPTEKFVCPVLHQQGAHNA
jgi:hypothetical protein